jgi:peroxiredoxin
VTTHLSEDQRLTLLAPRQLSGIEKDDFLPLREGKASLSCAAVTQKAFPLLGLAVPLCLACSTAPPPASEPSPLLKDVLPSFESKTLSGNRLDTSSFHGRPYVVSVVSADCESCEQTLAATQAMYSSKSDVSAVGVFHCDTQMALRWSKEYDLKFPILIDDDGAIARRLKVDQYPRTFVADRRGWVQWVGGKGLTEDALVAAVNTVR